MDNNHINESAARTFARELCAQRCKMICIGVILFVLFASFVSLLAAIIAAHLHGSEQDRI